MSKKAEGFSLRFVLINTGNISRKVLSKVLRSFDKNFERLQIETGNHIAHIDSGNIRRTIAQKFGEYLRKTAEGEAPWQLYGVELDKEGLLYLADHIEENAIREIGIGDMSIIHAYEQYRDTVPGIGRIMIWSTDTHLQGYCEENVSVTVNRRRKRS